MFATTTITAESMTSFLQSQAPNAQLCRIKAISATSFFIPSKIQNFKPAVDNSQFLDSPPSAALLNVADNARVITAVPGETYALNLQNFPESALLSVFLIPSAAPSTKLGTITSHTTDEQKGQIWSWEVPSSQTPGMYFLKAIIGQNTALNDKFAYSQAFEIGHS